VPPCGLVWGDEGGGLMLLPLKLLGIGAYLPAAVLLLLMLLVLPVLPLLLLLR